MSPAPSSSPQPPRLRPTSAFERMTLILLAAFLSACATKELPKLSDDPTLQIKRVAVVSVAAGTFNRMHVGNTIFGNESQDIEIEDWGIDKHIEKAMREELADKYKISAVDASYLRRDFLAVNSLVGKKHESPAFWEPNWLAITPAIGAHCAMNSLDAILVISKIYVHVPGRTTVFGGVGLYTEAGWGNDPKIYLVAKSGLFNCKTFEVIQSRVISNKQARDWRVAYRALPIEKISDSLAETKVGSWTPEQKQTIRQQLIKLPENALKETLASIFSTPATK